MERLRAEKLINMLKQKGIEVTAEQANSILKFLRMLADIVVTNHLTKDNRQEK